jgi:hypothetical protein
MWVPALTINPYDAHANIFYGQQNKQPQMLLRGLCGYATDIQGKLIDVGVFQGKDNKVRFASYNVLTSELASTGFENFEHNTIFFKRDEFFIFPSDKVLGLSTSSYLLFDNYFNHRSQYYFNYGKNEESWEFCTPVQYSPIAIIDSLYAQLIGSTVNSTWTIQPGYQAVSAGEGRSRLRVQLFEDSLIIRGFNMKSITVKRDADKIFKLPNYEFDEISKWTNPPIPQKRRKFDFVQYQKFTRHSPGRSNYTVQVQMWKVTWFHQIHILHKTEDKRGTVFEMTGSSQESMNSSYWYWFGHVTNFPQNLAGNFSKWYYFDSFMNCDVTLGEKGVKLTTVLDKGDPMIDALISFWDLKLVGQICTYNKTKKKGYLTYDFQMVTFDGDIHPVRLTGIIGKSLHVKSYSIPECV